MKFNKLLVGIILMLIQANGFLFAQTKFESERLALATQFAQAIKQGNLSNAEIMKKYVVEGGYFELDSIKNWADFYLNETRRSLKLSTDQSILIFKYLG
ncbi:MAG: hypothetical protein ACK5WF_16720, partial [Cyclobacteriaceae bacterium]